MHDEANERKAIEDALRDALARDELRLLYQPIVDVARERISGFEALIRWERDGGGVSPTKFIPIAEERSEEHTSELQSLMRISHAVFCLKKKKEHIHTCNSY